MVKVLLKFGLVGVVNTAIDYIILQLLIIHFNIHPHDSLHTFLANSCSAGIAIINSYIWNKKWTFNDKSKDHVQQFIKFLIVNVFSLLINDTVFVFLNAISPATVQLFHHIVRITYFTKIVAILVTMAFNFVAYRIFVFKNSDAIGEFDVTG